MAQYFKAMAAFANNQGGYILFGIGDKPRRLIGLKDKSLSQFEELKVEDFTKALENKPVDEPIEYIKRICSATSANYPVYFFMRQASMTASDALSVVKQTTSRGVAKDKLIERLEGKNILQSKLPISSTSAGKQKETYRQQWLTESISMPVENIGYCVEAVLYLSNEEIVEHDQYIRASLLGIYSTEYEKASSIIASNIRKAICRIDEGLYLED